MMNFNKSVIALLITAIIGCSKKTATEAPPTDPVVSESVKLKDISSFPVGIQCYIGILDYPVPKDAVVESFDRYTSTAFFWNVVEPQQGVYNYTEADKALRLTMAANQKLHAHALIYFEPTLIPEYLRNFNGSKEEFEQIVKTHIQTVVGHYKGQIASYDVVNELINDASGGNYYNDFLSRFYGTDADYEEFIGKCFTWTHEADPDALLFYNEAKLEQPDHKRLNTAINLVQKLKAGNIPINGIGSQTHTDIYTPQSIFDNLFKSLSTTGLQVHVSELDISVNENSQTGANYNYTSLSDDLAEQQKQAYKNLFYSYKSNVATSQQYGITMWDLMDHTSWLNQYRKEFPCLFDSTCKKKPAYFGAAIGILK